MRIPANQLRLMPGKNVPMEKIVYAVRQIRCDRPHLGLPALVAENYFGVSGPAGKAASGSRPWSAARDERAASMSPTPAA